MAYTPFLYCNSSLLHDLLLTEKAPFFFFLSAGVIVLLFLVLFIYLFTLDGKNQKCFLLPVCGYLFAERTISGSV